MVFNLERNSNTGSVSKNILEIFLPIQYIFVNLPYKLLEAKEILEQAMVVSSVIAEFRNKQRFFEISEIE